MRRFLSLITCWVIVLGLLAPAHVRAGAAPPLPVVFVPGYGASINVAALADPRAAPSLGGWHLFESLTPSYGEFLATLQENGVPYEIAYYDWRLPAAEASRLYLEPAIAAAKKKYHAASVNIVAHSFGGLVSRAYLQSPDYADDVATLAEVGVPDQGAPKAYLAWEGGQLPGDWKALGLLARYYQHIDPTRPGFVQALRKYFPSGQDLLPVVLSSIVPGSAPTDEDRALRCFKNDWLRDLNDDLPTLFARTRVIAVVGEGALNEEGLQMRRPDCRKALWPDGMPIPGLVVAGDGTVPETSTLAGRGAEVVRVPAGLHAELPGQAAAEIVRALYPNIRVSGPPTLLERFRNALSFLFDCPVRVAITLPDGTTVRSGQSSPYLEEDSAGGLVWMNLPREPGTYRVEVTALADTPVTAWVDDGPDLALSLRRGEVVSWDVEPDNLAHLPRPTITASRPDPMSAPGPAATSLPTAAARPPGSGAGTASLAVAEEVPVALAPAVVQGLMRLLEEHDTLPLLGLQAWVRIPLLGEPPTVPLAPHSHPVPGLLSRFLRRPP